MRNLTQKELDLAPDWATHYLIDKLDGDVIYESRDFCWWKGLNRKLSNHTFDESRSKVINRKPFDITQHKWSDPDFSIDTSRSHLEVSIQYHDEYHNIESTTYATINKQDAIALAKHFRLTAEDLERG